jgi:recombination protein RecA
MALTKASKSPYTQYDWLPTGLSKLDTLLGGGIPTKKIVEISGPYSVGKSTVALMVVAQAQKAGKPCLWMDVEYSFEVPYATSLGVDCDELDLLQEQYAEDCLDTAEKWAMEHEDGLIVLDAVGGILPRTEAEKEAGAKVIGGQAKLVATFCRKMVPLLAIHNHALLALNHEFTDIMFGNLKTSGGAKLEYHKSIWVRLMKTGSILKQGENKVGEVIDVEIRKNKLAPTMRQKDSLHLFYGKGFSQEASLFEDAVNKGLFTKKGNTFYFGEMKLGVGATKAREALQEPSFAAKVKSLL